MTLTSALVPLSFYPSTGQCADMVSAPHICFDYFLIFICSYVYFFFTSTRVHVCVYHFVLPYVFIKGSILNSHVVMAAFEETTWNTEMATQK